MSIEAKSAMASTRPVLEFGPFRIVRSKRLLFDGSKPVRLASRAFDILLTLLDRAGDVVDKRELIAAVWPNRVVEETNLRVHITSLRRALRDEPASSRYILNVPGRGYSFVGAVTPESGRAQPAVSSSVVVPSTGLPAPLTRMIGRETAVETLCRHVPERRLVTIVGTGGVGKSTLALEVASRLENSYTDGARFIHLAAVTDPAAIPVSIATVIELTVCADDPVASLVAFLKSKRMLLVLDNCEHLICPAARFVETLLGEAPGLSILATSREPLGAEGEWQFRLSPLEVPKGDGAMTAAQARKYSSVRLFEERAAAGCRAFELTDANATILCEVCRYLDGIPLALELAAARVDILGIKDLAARLNGRFLLSAGGRRTAAPRHQTLRATLQWSYELLSCSEKVVLRRLAIFKGPFTADSAIAIAAHGALNERNVLDSVMSLADKSLVTTDIGDRIVRHRLLHTTRAYALEKLDESDDWPDILRWHAEHHLNLLRTAEADWEAMSRAEWVAKHGPSIDDVRAALDWAFSTGGDATLGVALTAAAVPFGFQLALIDESADCTGRSCIPARLCKTIGISAH